MKKIVTYMSVAVMMLVSAACQKTIVDKKPVQYGYLSFAEFTLGLDEEVVTKATEANGAYFVRILKDGDEVLRKTYSEVKNNGNLISLEAGDYTLVASSYEGDVPLAEFEQPIYGVSKDFTIVAGETLPVGQLTCTLLQCKVTVAYSDEFLANVTGAGSTKVSLTSGSGLEYVLNADKTYEQSAGYFAVSGNTMEVVFSGNIEGKSQKMTKTFTGVAPRQWRQIKFVVKKNEQGNATFDIEIQDLISDVTLNNDVQASETIIGTDPEAPKGDGGMKLVLDEGCDETITWSETDLVYDPDGNQINSTGLIYIPIEPCVDNVITMSIKLKALIPDGLAEFNVDIETSSADFAGAVEAANATHIDLIHPTCSDAIFALVPFPHGEEILGETEIYLDLSNAQGAISSFPGTHLFTMTTVDQNGMTKINKVTMYVE